MSFGDAFLALSVLGQMWCPTNSARGFALFCRCGVWLSWAPFPALPAHLYPCAGSGRGQVRMLWGCEDMGQSQWDWFEHPG